MPRRLLPLILCLTACAGPTPGPDKQFGGTLQGAMTGAGTGAITGFHIAAASGPGAAIGAGLGAVAGGIQGLAQDQIEEDLMLLAKRTQKERQISQVHETLEDHYRRRLALHPTRDIYPADLFFYGDESRLNSQSRPLVREIGLLNKRRLPYSRLAVVAYAKSKDANSEYGKQLVQRRARAIVNELARSGLEPRRLEARGVLLDAPLLIDPADSPSRYNQAIELVALDR